MGAIAKWLLFLAPASTQFKVSFSLDEIAIRVHKVSASCKAHRTTFRIAVDLGILTHADFLVEIVAQYL